MALLLWLLLSRCYHISVRWLWQQLTSKQNNNPPFFVWPIRIITTTARNLLFWKRGFGSNVDLWLQSERERQTRCLPPFCSVRACQLTDPCGRRFIKDHQDRFLICKKMVALLLLLSSSSSSSSKEGMTDGEGSPAWIPKMSPLKLRPLIFFLGRSSPFSALIHGLRVQMNSLIEAWEVTWWKRNEGIYFDVKGTMPHFVCVWRIWKMYSCEGKGIDFCL